MHVTEYSTERRLQAEVSSDELATFIGEAYSLSQMATLTLIPKKIGSFTKELTRTGNGNYAQYVHGDSTRPRIDTSNPAWVDLKSGALMVSYVLPAGAPFEAKVDHNVYRQPAQRFLRHFISYAGELQLKGDISGTGDDAFEAELRSATVWASLPYLEINHYSTDEPAAIAANIPLDLKLEDEWIERPTDGPFAYVPVGTNLLRVAGDF
jgi:hypothetical protein